MFNEKNRKWLIVGMAVVVMILTFTMIVVSFQKGEKTEPEEQQDVPSQTDMDVVYYDGDAYKYNYHLKNILFLGIDNKAEIDSENIPGTAGQADSIMLLSLNSEHKLVRVLQISRDSMTEIDVYDMNGNPYTTMEGQLALQYAYGNGAKNSCWAMKKTVSELLFELPIDGYIAMDIAAVSKINDLLGGVTLTIPEDYTAIDPAFIKGATITLNGSQAEKYVRYRDITVAESSHTRMRRQVQYIPALLQTFEDKMEDKEEMFKKLYSQVSEYVLTDLSAEQMLDVLEYTWQENDVEYIEGEVISDGQYEEFYIDDEKLQKKIIKMFYNLK